MGDVQKKRTPREILEWLCQGEEYEHLWQIREGERRINPYTEPKNRHQSKLRVTVLLRATDTIFVLRSMQEGLQCAA